MNARVVAVNTLAGVFRRGCLLDDALPAGLMALEDPRDRALATEICYGVLRWYFRLEHIAARLLHRPLKARDAELRALLYCGLYQMGWMRVPEHAAVAETVDAAKTLHFAGAPGLVNAVLRRYQRERESIQQIIEGSPAARYAHPDWLIDAVRSDWPRQWQAILDANNRRPPMHLRINLRAATREQCLADLTAAGFAVEGAALVETGVRLASAADVDELPGFRQGMLSVQDFGAQLAAPLLDAQPGERVLDACAAPGGKAAHILERTPGLGELVALDRDARRLEMLRANLARLHLSASVVAADAAHPDKWWDRRPFDRILLDAPCSATGVIRRHPDIKLLRKPGQFSHYAAAQQALLRAALSLLRPRGRLLYATCSILRRENDRQIDKFVRNHKDVRVLPIGGPWGTATEFGRQTLPGIDDTDGFYYALLEKT